MNAFADETPLLLTDRPGIETRVVRISGQARQGRPEGVIEQVRHHAEGVEIDLLLWDGRDATASLTTIDWDWLELRLGDIVAVHGMPHAPAVEHRACAGCPGS